MSGLGLLGVPSKTQPWNVTGSVSYYWQLWQGKMFRSSAEKTGTFRRNGWVLLISAVLFVSACEVVFHWLLGRGVFPSLRAFTFTLIRRAERRLSRGT